MKRPPRLMLPEACAARGLDEIEAMNILQDMGVVSDNCVDLGDVADVDVDRAVGHLINMARRRK